MGKTGNGKPTNKAFGKSIIRDISKAVARLIQLTLIIFWFALGLSPIFLNHLVDFLAFIGAGRRLLSFQSPYGFYPTSYGASVYQSVPWLAWFFALLALLPNVQAWQIYLTINSVLLLLIIILVGRTETIKLDPLNFTYVFACVMALSYFCLLFGQTTILLLAALSIMIVAFQHKSYAVAGALVPLVLFKPQLVIWFLVYAYLNGNRRFIVSSFFSTIFIMSVSFVLQPSWPIEMIKTIVAGQVESTMESWRFSTLTGLLSLAPKYGLLVLPLSVPALIWLRPQVCKFPIGSQLAIALAFSLATSPYAFAYDLPLLIPALFWLFQRWSIGMAVVWTLMAAIPILLGFTGASYFATLTTCILIIYKIFRSFSFQQSDLKGKSDDLIADASSRSLQ